MCVCVCVKGQAMLAASEGEVWITVNDRSYFRAKLENPREKQTILLLLLFVCFFCFDSLGAQIYVPQPCVFGVAQNCGRRVASCVALKE